ncbi:MAG: alpha/beta fold hydrolase [Hyphomicrobiaceae bacterium]
MFVTILVFGALLGGCAANQGAGDPSIAPPVAADVAPGASEVARTRDFQSDDAPYATVKVFYATDRAKTGESAPNDKYGPGRGKLLFGVAEVSIPRDHRMGTLEGPAVSRLEFREDPERHVVLLAVAERDRASFFREMGARIAASPQRSALVFIHGYNITFAEAARRTAQLSYDLAFDGAPLFYSWPSQGNVPGYVIDANNTDWTVTHLKDVLGGIVERSGADNVYVIAHSLGTRALVDAVEDLGRERANVRARIREVILAAPDIDAEIFVRDIAPRIATGGSGVTVYASANDKAMVASRNLHGYPRVGDSSRGLALARGIDTIDATGAGTDFVGHAYYGDSVSIISDMFELIHNGKRPVERQWLTPAGEASKRYWVFRGPGS